MKFAYSFLLIFILSIIKCHGEEEEKFVCAKSGRYENPTDDTCNSFFLCSYSLQGELIQTQYSCPEKTIFSPHIATCSKNYTCPRVSRSVRDVVQIETINNIHYHCKDELINNYECRRSGRYAELVGTTCRKYYLCSLLQSGTYMKTLHECPEGSFFDPRTQKCHLNYECPCQRNLAQNKWISTGDSSKQEERREQIGWAERYSWTEQVERWTEHYRWTAIPQEQTTKRRTEASSIRTSTESCIEADNAKPFVCKEEGKFPDRKDVTCTDYFFCSKLLNGGFVKTKLSCTYGSTFDPNLKKCSMRYECPCQIETVSTYQTIRSTPPTTQEPSTSTDIVYTTEYHPTPLDCQIPKSEFVCTRKGRYPDRKDSSCNTYFLCESDKDGKFMRKRYRCPRCLTFNPSTEKCTDNYVCPCSFTEAPSIISTGITNSPSRQTITGKTKYTITTERNGGSSTGKTERSSSETKSTMNNSISTSENQKTSQSTTELRSSSTKKQTMTTGKSSFTPTEKSSNSTENTEEISKSSKHSSSTSRSTGKTKNPLSSASTEKTTSSGLTGSTGKTSSPRGGSSTSSNGKTQSTPSKTPSTGSSTSEITKISKITTEQPGSPSTKKETRTTSDCIIPPNNEPFKCVTKGRFPDKTDLSCSSYFMCSALSNGTLTKTKYSCPRHSFFNPLLQRCSELYECPCSNTPGSTSKYVTVTTRRSTGKSSSTPTEPANPTENTDEITKSSKDSSSTSRSTGKTKTPSSSASTEKISTTSSGLTGSSGKSSSPRGSASTSSTGTTQNSSSKTPSAGSSTSGITSGSERTTEQPGSSSTKKETTPKTTGKSSSTPSEKPSISTENTENTDEITRSSKHSSSTSRSTGKTKTPSSSASTEKISTTSAGLTGSTGKSSSPRGNATTSSTGKTQQSSSKTPSAGSSTSGITSGSKRTTEQPGSSSTKKETRTTSHCIIPPSNKPFKCFTKGRFPDTRDLSCSSYFLCSALNNGTLIKTKYRCPKNSFFDPEVHRCSKLYECPCSTTPVSTSKHSSTSPKTTAKSSSTPSEEPSNPTENTENTDEITRSSKHSSSTSRSTGKTEATTSSESTKKISTTSSGLTGSTGKSSSPRGSASTSSTGKTQHSSSKTLSTESSSSGITSGSKRTTEHPGSSSTKKETRTTSQCIIPPSNKPFKCLTKGRFPDKRDLSCSSYFLCSALNNGTLIKTKYRCPRNSFFDPDVHRCSKLYECPCSTTPVSTSKHSSTTPKTTGKSSSTPSEEPSNPTVNTENTDEITRSSKHSSSSSRSTGKTKTTTSSESTKKISTTSSGLTGSTGQSSSPRGSASTSSTGKTQHSSSKMPSTESSSSGITSGSKRTTEHPGSSSTKKETRTTSQCIIPPSNKPFKCFTKGRFPDKRDLSCSSYFLCSALNNGTLIKTKYRCPRNSFFDPDVHRCSKLYECPCSTTPVSTSKHSSTTPKTTGKSSSTPSEEPSNPTENTENTDEITRSSKHSSSTSRSTGKTKTTTSSESTKKISTTSSGLTGSTGQSSSPRGSARTSSTGKTQHSSSKTPSTESSSSGITSGSKRTTEHPGSSSTKRETRTTSQCIIPPSNKPFKCFTKGRFPDKRDLSCSSYFLCSALNNGTLIKTKYRCPRNSFFDPDVHRCSKLYECPCSTTPVSTSKHSSTTPKTTGKSSSTPSEEPSNPTENTENTDEITRSSKHSSSTSRSTGKTKTTTSSESTKKISTTSSGLTGSTGKSSSPRGSASTSSTGKTQHSSSKTLSTESSSSGITSGSKRTTEHPGSSSTKKETRTTSQCIIPPSNKPFKCFTKGRFPDKRDLSCSSYFLCSALNNGTLIKTKYRCPRNSFFDPDVHRCSKLYECPCSTTPVSTSKHSSTTPKTTGKSSSTPSEEPSNPTENTENTDEITRSSKHSSSTSRSTGKTKTTTSSESTKKISTTSSGLTGSTGQSSSPRGSASTSSTGKTQHSSSKTPSTESSSSGITSGSKRTTEHPGSSSTKKETRTTSQCIIPPSNKPFKCFTKGRFPDKRDLSCSSYFLCSALNNGTLIKTKYRCPRNSFFDPDVHRCSKLYECPCSITPVSTSKHSSTTPKTTGKSSSTPSEEPSNPTENTENTDEITRSSKHSSSTSRSTGKTKTTTSSESTKKISTTSSSLTGSTGKSSSPRGSASTSSTGKTQHSSSKTPSTESSSSGITSGSKRTTEHPGSSSTEKETRTTSQCIIPPSNKPFKCFTKGRFPDKRDLSCSSYFLCSALNNGTLIKTKYRCPRNSFFDPDVHRCSKLYECPCSTTPVSTSKHSSTTPKTTGKSSSTPSKESSNPTENTENTDEITRSSKHLSSTSRSTGKTKTPSRSESTEKITTTSSGLTGSTGKSSSPRGSASTLSTGKTQHSSSKTLSTESSSSGITSGSKRTTEHPGSSSTEKETRTTSQCIIPPSNKPFKCFTKGRFPDKRDLSCSSYFLCSALNNGTLIKTKYRCPKNSFFDPDVHRCSKLYECPCSTTPVSTSKHSSTTPKTTGESSSTPSKESSNPTENTENTDEITRSSKHSSSTSRSTGKTKTLSSSESTEKITTTSSGLTGSTGQSSSPRGSASTSSTGKTQHSSSKTPSTESSSSGITSGSKRTTEHPGSSSTKKETRTTSQCIIPPSNKPFKCFTKGRFPDKRDLSCSSYFLCSALNNGTLIKTKYRCPKNSFFDPEVHRCSKLYECPCSTTPVSTSKHSSTTPKTTGKSSSTPSEEPSNPTENTKNTDEITRSSKHSSSTSRSTGKTKTTTSSESTKKISTTSSGLTGSTGKSSSPRGSASTSSTGKTQHSSSKTPSTESSSSGITSGSKRTTEHPGSSSTKKETRTTSQCIIPPSNKPFKCFTKGRFPDKRDLSCSSYFLCSALNNGTLIKTKYRCPRNSFFDPDVHRCSKLYECPCSTTPVSTSKHSSTTPKTTGKSSSTPSEEPSNPTENTENTDEITRSSKHSSSTSRSTGKTKTTTSSESTKKISTTSSGLTGSTGKSSSPRGSASTSSTSKTQHSSSKTPSTESSSSGITSGSKRTTEHPGSSSTKKETRTTSQCIIPPSNKPFKCFTKGRFPDKRDLSCSSYFLCSALNNGTLIKTKYRCPRNSFFDPDVHRCSKLYECPCSTTPVSTSKHSSTTPKTTGKSSSTPSEEPSNPTENTENTDEITRSSKHSSSSSRSTGKTKTTTSSESTKKISTTSSGLTGSTGQSSSPRGSASTSSTGKTQHSSSKMPSTESSSSGITSGSKRTTEHPGSSSTKKETRTTSQCIIPPSNKPFKCLTKGRFPDKRDLSCSSYFLCSALNNGTLIKTKYRCPRNSFFDPDVHRCSKLYECPCSTTPVSTSKQSSTTPKTTGKSSSTPSEEPSNPTENTKNTDEITRSSKHSSSTSRSTGRTKTPSSSESTEKISTTSSGVTGSTGKSSSPRGSASTSSSGKTQNSSSKTPSAGSSTSGITSGSKRTTEQPGSSSTKKETRTTSHCIMPPSNKPFKCLTKGRFPDKRDLSCSSYFLCSELNNGTLIKTKYRCPRNSFFDPAVHRCSKLYECPCSTTTASTSKHSSTTPRTTGKSSSAPSEEPSNPTENTENTGEITRSSKHSSSTSRSTGKTKTPSSSASTEKISTTSSGLTGSTGKSSSPRGSASTSSTGKTQNSSSKTPSTGSSTSGITSGSKRTTEQPGSSSTTSPTNKTYTPSDTYSSSDNSESTGSMCIEPPSTFKFVCETKGRFADLRDKSCVSYFLCSLLEDGTFVQASYRCSNGLKFNPVKQNCSPFYDCPCDVTTTTPTTSQASTFSTLLPDICQPTREEFVCTSVGRFPKPGDVSCCTYYSCSRSLNGTIAQTEFSCPEGSSFDPVFRTCSNTYQCPCHVTESPKYFSTSSDDCIVPTEEFVCTAPGRFPNRQDVSCCNYFLCNDVGNGTFTKTEYNCPMGKSYDPELKRCSSLYICPCSRTENPVTSTIETSSQTSISPTRVTNSRAPTTDITQPPECDISANNPEHVCNQRGRFKDNKDITCSNYFLCSRLRNGQFIRTRYSCPRFSFFDPSLGLCTTTYKCPCINTLSTVSMSTGKITKIPGTRAPWHIITKKTPPTATPRKCVPANPSLSEFICSTEGKFLNPLDTKCTSYIHCVQKASVLVKTVVNCEGMTAFDANLRKCTASAVCEVCKE